MLHDDKDNLLFCFLSSESVAQGKGGKKKGPLPIVKKVISKDDLDIPVNEELKALEAHMLSVTKAGKT